MKNIKNRYKILTALIFFILAAIIHLTRESENTYQFNEQINKYTYQSELQKLWQDNVRKIHIITINNKVMTFIYKDNDISNHELKNGFDEPFTFIKKGMRARSTLIIKNSGYESNRRETPHFYLEGDLIAKEFFTENYDPLHVANIFGRAISRAVDERYTKKLNQWELAH